MTGKAVVLQFSLVLTLLSSGVSAGLIDTLHLGCGKERNCCETPLCVRPDNYCGKPIPCLSCPSGCCRCDNYCGKGIPCIPCLPQCHRCNDYCRKPSPPLCPIRLIRPGCKSPCGEGEGCGR